MKRLLLPLVVSVGGIYMDARIGSTMGPAGVKKVEIVKIGATATGSAPPYQLILSAYFESADALQKAMTAPRMPEVITDIAKFYDGMPDMMIGEVLG